MEKVCKLAFWGLSLVSVQNFMLLEEVEAQHGIFIWLAGSNLKWTRYLQQKVEFSEVVKVEFSARVPYCIHLEQLLGKLGWCVRWQKSAFKSR